MISIGAVVRDRVGERNTFRRGGVRRVVREVPPGIGFLIFACVSFAKYTRILIRIISLELHRRIVGADAPGETVVMPFANPVQFFAVVPVASILRSQEVAIRGIRERDAVANAFSVQVAGGAQ